MLKHAHLVSILFAATFAIACSSSVHNASPSGTGGTGGADAGQPPDGASGGDAVAPNGRPSIGPGFLRVVGTEIVDGAGQPVLLRAVGLGNWLLPEGYMWKLAGSGKARDIEKAIEDVIGPTQAGAFWTSWRDSFFTETDAARAAQIGFNAIRLAMNSRLLMPEGQDAFDETEFDHLSKLVDWCEKHDLYVIFDMHAAPGGQTGHNAIDDSPTDTPELFNSPTYQDRLVRLWTEIARRFADSRVVAGFDLLNEPIHPDFSDLNDKLWPLYVEVGNAIRGVDPNHAIIVEGAAWADNWSALAGPFDANMIYSFHKYWDNTDQLSVQPFIDKRTEWNRPIWCGEMGEPRENDWPQRAVALLESNNVGWTYWPWKKMDTTNDPYSIDIPTNWDLFQSYVADPTTQPDAGTMQSVFDDYLVKISEDKCRYNQPVACQILPLTCDQ
jgi:endoglucanase